MARPRRILYWLVVFALSIGGGALIGVFLPISTANSSGGLVSHGERESSNNQSSTTNTPGRDPVAGQVLTPGEVDIHLPHSQHDGFTDEQVLAMPWIPKDLRRRLKEAIDVATAANAGDAMAQRKRDLQRATEPDPRVRQALTTGKIPPLGESRMGAPTLPQPVKQAEAGTSDGYWLTPDKDGTYKSRITVDGDGRATVDTVLEGKNYGDWHVRYNGWAWRDADGKLIIDARGQQVELLKTPGAGSWSPDSMIVGPTGLIDIIDDQHQTGSGTTERSGNG